MPEDSAKRTSGRTALSIVALLSGFIAGLKTLVGYVTASGDGGRISANSHETTTTTTTTTTTEAGATTTTTTTTETTTTPAEGPQEGGKPVIGLATPPDTLNPLKAGSVYSFYVINKVMKGTETVAPVTHRLISLETEEILREETFTFDAEPGESEKKGFEVEELPPGEYRAETEWKDLLDEKSFVVEEEGGGDDDGEEKEE